MKNISETRDAVKALHNAGAWLFPCDLPSKRPCHLSEKGFWTWKTAKLTDKNIDHWLKTAPIFGMVPGKSGLWIVDLDRAGPGVNEDSGKYEGKAFCEATEQEQKAAYDEVIARTGEPLAAYRSGGKTRGWHMIYKLHSNDLKIKQKPFTLTKNGIDLGRGDIRVAKGYIIVWDPDAFLKAHELAPAAKSVRVGKIYGTDKQKQDNRQAGAPSARRPVQIDDLDAMERDIKKCLDALPLNDRDEWVSAGMCIHFETRGSQRGLDLWLEASRKSGKWKEGDCEREWKSFKEDHENPVQMGTLEMMANDFLTGQGKPPLELEIDWGPVILGADDLGVLEGLQKLGCTPQMSTRSQKKFIQFDDKAEKWAGRNGLEPYNKGIRGLIKGAFKRRFERMTEYKDGPKPQAFEMNAADWDDFMAAVFLRCATDPFADWLEGLDKWDGTPRLESFFTDRWKSTSDDGLLRWAARYLFLLPLYRTYQRPYHCDTALLLCGPTGIGKSKTLEWLFPKHLRATLHNGNFRLDVSLKRMIEAGKGRAICVANESAGVLAVDWNNTKAWMTCDTDTMRLTFRPDEEDIARTAALVFTSNDPRPLPFDPSGSRRFGSIKLERKFELDDEQGEQRMDEDREQLWAEALVRRTEFQWTPQFPRELAATQREVNSELENKDDDAAEYLRALFKDAAGDGHISLPPFIDHRLNSKEKPSTSYKNLTPRRLAHMLREYKIAKNVGFGICKLSQKRTRVWEYDPEGEKCAEKCAEKPPKNQQGNEDCTLTHIFLEIDGEMMMIKKDDHQEISIELEKSSVQVCKCAKGIVTGIQVGSYPALPPRRLNGGSEVQRLLKEWSIPSNTSQAAIVKKRHQDALDMLEEAARNGTADISAAPRPRANFRADDTPEKVRKDLIAELKGYGVRYDDDPTDTANAA